MKKFIKFSIVSLFFISGFSIFALDADNQKTLLETVSQEKTKIDSGFNNSYLTIYNMFSSSVGEFLSSLDYKGLVCLGVIDDAMLLQKMQDDIRNLKLGFLNSYANIYTDALDIEQKKKILKDTNVSLFSNGRTYELEKKRIIEELDKLSINQSNLSKQFVISYQGKINQFVSDFQDYSKRNSALLKDISTQIKTILAIESSYKDLTSNILEYQKQLAGSGTDFFSKIAILKTASVGGLDASFQYTIDREIKRYKNIPDYKEVLLQQKIYALGLYEMQFDEKVNLLLEKWYDNKEFTQITNDVKKYLSLYYPQSKMQCSLFLNSSLFTQESANLFAKLTSFHKNLSFESLSGNKQSTQFQASITNRISVVVKLQKDITKTFSDTVIQKRNQLLQSSKNIIEDNNINKIKPELNISPIFKFTKPFNKNQYNLDIKILQQLLTNLGYYSNAIDGIYSSATIESVYQYQLAKGLLKGYDKKPQTWGWMGPATRSQLNKDLQ